MTILARALQTTANTEQVLYTVPAVKEALCTINVCNKGTSAATVRIGLLVLGETNMSQAPGGFIEYDASIPAGGVLERTGLLLEADSKIVVNASSTNVAYVVTGRVASAS